MNHSDRRAISMIRELMKDTRARATGIRGRLWNAWIDSFSLDLDLQQSTSSVLGFTA